MAWEEFEQDGVSGFTGDKAADEFSRALKAISRAYVDRFGRKPTIAEVLYSLQRVLRVHGSRDLEEGQALEHARLMIEHGQARTTTIAKGRPTSLDFSRYEGAYTDKTMPGYYLVDRKGTSGAKSNVEVIRVPRLEVTGRTVTAEYDILDPSLSDEDARSLIIRAVLKDFMDDAYRDEADSIEFVNVRGKETTKIPYPR